MYLHEFLRRQPRLDVGQCLAHAELSTEYVVTLVNGSQVRTGRRYRDAVRALIVQPK